MKKIATKKACKGKRSVTLEVFDCDNVLRYADPVNNCYKIISMPSFDEAFCLFYEWALQMYGIKTDITLHN